MSVCVCLSAFVTPQCYIDFMSVFVCLYMYAQTTYALIARRSDTDRELMESLMPTREVSLC